MISRDSHWLITGGPDGTARLWDLTAKDPVANPYVLPGHTDAIRNVVFSPDNRRLITGSYDEPALVWELERLPDYEHSKSKPVILKGEGQMSTIDISSDSRWVATGIGKWFLFWDLMAKEPAASPITLPITGEISRAALPATRFAVLAWANSATWASPSGIQPPVKSKFVDPAVSNVYDNSFGTVGPAAWPASVE